MKTGVQMALGGFLLALPSPTFLNAAVLTSSVSAHLRGAPHTASPYAAGGGYRRRPSPAAREAGSGAPRFISRKHKVRRLAVRKFCRSGETRRLAKFAVRYGIEKAAAAADEGARKATDKLPQEATASNYTFLLKQHLCYLSNSPLWLRLSLCPSLTHFSKRRRPHEQCNERTCAARRIRLRRMRQAAAVAAAPLLLPASRAAGRRASYLASTKCAD